MAQIEMLDINKCPDCGASFWVSGNGACRYCIECLVRNAEENKPIPPGSDTGAPAAGLGQQRFYFHETIDADGSVFSVVDGDPIHGPVIHSCKNGSLAAGLVDCLNSLASPTAAQKMEVVVFTNGEWKEVRKGTAWEYENDPDYLVTIPGPHHAAVEIQAAQPVSASTAGLRDAVMEVYSAFYGPNPGNSFSAWVAVIAEKVNALEMKSREGGA